jgi:hypothetical protein
VAQLGLSLRGCLQLRACRHVHVCILSLLLYIDMCIAWCVAGAPVGVACTILWHVMDSALHLLVRVVGNDTSKLGGLCGKQARIDSQPGTRTSMEHAVVSGEW